MNSMEQHKYFNSGVIVILSVISQQAETLAGAISEILRGYEMTVILARTFEWRIRDPKGPHSTSFIATLNLESLWK